MITTSWLNIGSVSAPTIGPCNEWHSEKTCGTAALGGVKGNEMGGTDKFLFVRGRLQNIIPLIHSYALPQLSQNF
jgi:hypothetical protein